jgi:hypothetical protein
LAAAAALNLEIHKDGQRTHWLATESRSTQQLLALKRMHALDDGNLPVVMMRDIAILKHMGIDDIADLLQPNSRRLAGPWAMAARCRLGELTTSQKRAYMRLTRWMHSGVSGANDFRYTDKMNRWNPAGQEIDPGVARSVRALSLSSTTDIRQVSIDSLGEIARCKLSDEEEVARWQNLTARMLGSRHAPAAPQQNIKRDMLQGYQHPVAEQGQTGHEAFQTIMQQQKKRQKLTAQNREKAWKLYTNMRTGQDVVDDIIEVQHDRSGPSRRIKRKQAGGAQLTGKTQYKVTWQPTVMQEWQQQLAQSIGGYSFNICAW